MACLILLYSRRGVHVGIRDRVRWTKAVVDLGSGELAPRECGVRCGISFSNLDHRLSNSARSPGRGLRKCPRLLVTPRSDREETLGSP
jgi:hypothetical protein